MKKTGLVSSLFIFRRLPKKVFLLVNELANCSFTKYEG